MNAEVESRPAAVAGAFYPARPDTLRSMVTGFLDSAGQAPDPRIAGLVAPHAGYEYSGAVAGFAYAVVRGSSWDRVVILAPSHFEYFTFASAFTGSAYQTPLGMVPIDREFTSMLCAACSLVKPGPHGHLPPREHSLEVQLPFLQIALNGLRIVAVVLGESRVELSSALGEALARCVKSAAGRTLIVASSDLSHFLTYERATDRDRRTLDAITNLDPETLVRECRSEKLEACGAGPIVAARIACHRLGAGNAHLLTYRNSGDVTGDSNRVVGYGALAFSH